MAHGNSDMEHIRDLLAKYNPAEADNDFDSLRAQLVSNYCTFDALCKYCSTSIVAQPLLLSLDFKQVLEDAKKEPAQLKDIERWIGYMPENRTNFPRQTWFNQFAEAALEVGEPSVLRKLVRLGLAHVVANLPGWNPDDRHVELFGKIVYGDVNSKYGDAILLAFLNRHTQGPADERELLLGAFLKPIQGKEDWIANIILNRKIISPPASLMILLRSISPLSLDFLDRLSNIWSDTTFIINSNYQRHAQLSAVIRYCFRQFKDEIPENIIGHVIRGISEHLSCNVEEKQLLGKMVAEDYMLLHQQAEIFGLDRSTFEDIYYTCLNSSQDPLPKASKQNVKQKNNEVIDVEENSNSLVESEDPNKILDWPWPKFPLEFLQMSESGVNEKDDDACSLEPYDLTDDPMDGLASVPKQLGQIPGMLASDKYEVVQTALVNLSDLIQTHRQRPDTHRRAPRLVWTLLELENRFGLADFDMNRSRALLSLVVCAPKESAPAIARAIYSKEINLGVKLVALSALMDGARLLANGGVKDDDESETVEEESSSSSSNNKNLLGKVLRKSRKFETKPARMIVNHLAPLALEYFFTPLYRRIADFENEPILLCKVAAALGLIVEQSRHAGGEAIRMAEGISQLIPWLNARRESEVRRTALYLLAAIASVSRAMMMEWQDWLQTVAEDDPDSVARELAKRLLLMLGETI